jgi:acetyl-CoA carboxylase carboxyltransferase component
MATIRHGASAMAALYNAVIPIFTIIIRRSFGVAGGAFANPDGDDWSKRVAWWVFPNVVQNYDSNLL